jgi:RHS repeat-associated protein
MVISNVTGGSSPTALWRDREVADEGEVILLSTRTRQEAAPCPICGRPTARVLGFHRRTIADVSVDGRRVVISVRMRRLIGPELGCPRQTFREQVPGLLERYQRRTTRAGRPTRFCRQGVSGQSGHFPLMGLRLYNPATGRFLQTDPVAGGSATSYDYCNGDPVNCTDTNGQCPSWNHPIKKAACKAAVWATEYGIEAVGEIFCGAEATVVFALCSAIVTGLSAAVSYYVETRWDGHFSWGEAISNVVITAFVDGVLGGATMKFLKSSTGRTFLRRSPVRSAGISTSPAW